MIRFDYLHYIKTALRSLPYEARRVSILGGGALRAFFDGTEVKDYDLFFRSYADYSAAVVSLSYAAVYKGTFKRLPAPRGTAQFRHVETGRLFNLIGFYFDTPEGHCDSFDFSCCQMVAWLDDEGALRTLEAEGAVDSARNRVIRVVNNNGEERTLARIHRYTSGYSYSVDGAGPAPTSDHIRSIIRAAPTTSRGYPEEGET